MEEKDPPPFGYTFSTDFNFSGSPTDSAFPNGQSLLNETESQGLIDFFHNANPFGTDNVFPPATEAKDGLDNFNWGLVSPAHVHSVSATIPDQTQLHHGFHSDQVFTHPPLPVGRVGSMQEAMHLPSALFDNLHPSHMNGRAFSFHGMPSSSANPQNISPQGLHNVPMVNTSHGLINEQLAALLPNHHENGSIDASLAAQFASSDAQHRHEAELAQLERQRPHLKRSYTYGTDSAFNGSGFHLASPVETEDDITRRLLGDLRHARPLTRPATNGGDDAKPSPTGHFVHVSSEDDPESDEASDDNEDEDEDRPAKKRRKARHLSTNAARAAARKNSSAPRSSKNRKASLDDHAGKKKRTSSAGQKPTRENLTEEQKRSNHILSEQKRRNLIKRGFDDLHDLVPEIRNGGLSKSSILVAAADFLDKIIQENDQHRQFLNLATAADG